MRAHPRVYIRARPHSPRTPTEQDYEESPRPATATGSKKKCFSIALRPTLVVLEMH